MNIYHSNLANCHTAQGLTVVIDVIRAFTTAPYAFGAGVKEILPVSGVAEALALRDSMANALVMGEVDGLKPAGFDLGNSPSALIGANLSGRSLIQRTSAGTQGLTRVPTADIILASSFAVAGATLAYIRQLKPNAVTLVSTGTAGEDQALATYLEAHLQGKKVDATPLLAQVRIAGEARIQKMEGALPAQVEGFKADLECCVSLDLYDFALVVQRETGRLVMRPH